MNAYSEIDYCADRETVYVTPDDTVDPFAALNRPAA